MKKSRNLAQWFKMASETIGGAWQYRGETGTRAHQLLLRYGKKVITSGKEFKLLWHDEPITKRALEKIYKESKSGTIIAGDGYGYYKHTDINTVVDGFAEAQGLTVHHNLSEPAIWWIHKEAQDEPTDYAVDEKVSSPDDSVTLPGSTLSGDQ